MHFISGLPRSGSTLLSAILRQNPMMHAGMTSPVGSMVMAMQKTMSKHNESAIFLNNEHRKRILKGIFDSYYDNANSIIFDTNRAWCSKLPLLKTLFDDVKVICSVRDVSWIMDSIEVIIRRNPLELSGLFGFEPYGSVFTRINQIAESRGLVGGAVDGLREAFFSENNKNLLLVDYEALCLKPEQAMRKIYAWLGYEYFDHDFNNVAYEAHDFDVALGTPGLHTVRQKVEFIERKTILPPELFDRFLCDNFWRHPPNLAYGNIIY